MIAILLKKWREKDYWVDPVQCSLCGIITRISCNPPHNHWTRPRHSKTGSWICNRCNGSQLLRGA